MGPMGSLRIRGVPNKAIHFHRGVTRIWCIVDTWHQKMFFQEIEGANRQTKEVFFLRGPSAALVKLTNPLMKAG